jgi:hypothetical protein
MGNFTMRILFFYAEGVDVYNQESLTNINSVRHQIPLLYHRSGQLDGKRIAPMTQPSAGSTKCKPL